MRITKWRTYTEFLHRRRMTLLISAGLMAVLSFLSIRSIEMKTRIEDMLPEENHIVESYTAIGEKFNTSSILLTVENGSPREMGEAADKLVTLLKDDRELSVNFRGENNSYNINFKDGDWHCSCDFFSNWGLCSHTMALEKILGDMLPSEALTTPSDAAL